jgi:hypothetical protein
MNKAIKALLTTLLNQRKIGGNHIPEELIISSKTRWLNKDERRDFKREYKELINSQTILKVKKRTGKGFDWHISLNPKSVEEVLRITESEVQ